MNPEFRQTLNAFSHNLQDANQAAQENIYTFTQLYVDPCLSGVKACLQDCTGPCFPTREDSIRRRRGRGRSRGRAENFFDFYDDWDDGDDANTNALAWGDDELDSLLAGSRSPNQGLPRRQRAMSYGSRGRRLGPVHPSDSEQDPTIIPGSSYLGFLEQLPWRIGARVLRYKPSAANLQENPGGLRMSDAEAQHLLEEDQSPPRKKGHGRQRSETQNSRSTMNSLSSRGDLIMSDEEGDAVPLDDEFALALGRRTTNVTSDQSSGKTGSSGRRPGTSRRSTRTPSSKSTRSQRSSSRKSLASPVSPSVEQIEAPSMQELRHKEEQIRKEEEMEIEQKREAAQRLAFTKGLSSADAKSPTAEIKPDPIGDDGTETPSMIEIASPRPMSPEPMSESRNEEAAPQQRDSSPDTSKQDPP